MWWLVGLLTVVIGVLALLMYIMHSVTQGIVTELSASLSTIDSLKRENKALKASVKRLEGKGTQKKKRNVGPDLNKFGV